MITAIANQKGGVAKTTSTIALGGLLAEDASCLVIDLDPQGNLTTGLGLTLSPRQPTVFEVLTGRAGLEEAIVPARENLHLLPADLPLAQAEQDLLKYANKFTVLRDRLQPVRTRFDYVLIDCPPSLGLLTGNALVAADCLIVPVQCQFFALKGLEAMLKNIVIVQEKLNPTLKILGILPTMAEPHTLVTQQTLEALKQQANGIPVFSPVPKSVKFPESNLAGEPIHRYTREWRLVQPYREVVRAIALHTEA